MKCRDVSIFIFNAVVVVSFTTPVICESQVRGTVKPSTNEIVQRSCLTKQELALTVQEFSSTRRYPELERAKLRLLDNAKVSANCRREVIAVLIEMMDKPQLDAYRDFQLWRYGSELLGDLKATESLDLLIKHLSFTDGTSINVTHYPAMLGTIKMGRPAIAKLGIALQQNSDRNYRLNGVFCIAQIGGPQAIRVLKTVIASEQDSCVRRFIEVSIEVLNNPRTPGEITVQDRNKWFAAFYCGD